MSQELALLGFLARFEEEGEEDLPERESEDREDEDEDAWRRRMVQREAARRRYEERRAEDESSEGLRRRGGRWLRKKGVGIVKTLLEKVNSIVAGALGGGGRG